MIQKKYNIQEFIGKGKFGSVFLGENTYSKEKVAIKIEEHFSQISVLKNETRILEYLSRNGLRTQIPQVFWFGIYNDIHYALIMTHFSGKDLSLEEGKGDYWFVSAIRILEKIHKYGVIHRDIKPAHFIFVVNKWVLIDFGFATFFQESESLLSLESGKTSEYIIGTPNYISLNIHNGFKPTPIDDIWSIVYIYIRILLPELFIFTIATATSGNIAEYPSNHILNIHNQIRKEKKELWNNPEFWEKKGKIFTLIQLLLSTKKKIPYTDICNLIQSQQKNNINTIS